MTRLLDVAATDRDRLLAALLGVVSAATPLRSVVQPTLAGSRNGGDVLVHLRFRSRREWFGVADAFAAVFADPAVTRVNGADYSGRPVRATDLAGSVYRALLLRVAPRTPDAVVARFERELSSMPRYVSAIRAWQLSRVGDAVGDTSWTHVFEQEFCDVEGLTGPYLMHPIHWAVIDRWFDPETTDVIIRDRLCHSFCAITESVLS